MRKVLFIAVSVLAGLLAVAWLTVILTFNSKDHSAYDVPRHPPTGTRASESGEHAAEAKAIAAAMANPPQASRDELLRTMRKQFDERGETATINSQIQRVDTGEVSGEWVVAPNADRARRVLFIHGGGYMMGSPRSHRRIASRFSEISRAAVFSVEYRLMPEQPRMAGIEDCRTAYAWILANGPDGAAPAETLIVAGDSAGGNLALATIAWARDSGLRAADAVVALSPQTDATFGSPSLARNIATDVMQGSSLGPAVQAPKVIALAVGFGINRINPSSPLVSPLLGDLSNLPPTLLQASESEMFLDDAVRYVNKTNAQGSHAVLQTWPFMMHVWHAFDVPEAEEAFGEIEKFIALHTGQR